LKLETGVDVLYVPTFGEYKFWDKFWDKFWGADDADDDDASVHACA